MPGIPLLLKFTPYLIVLVLVGYFADVIFERGRKVEKSYWLEERLKAQVVAQNQITAAYEVINKQRTEHQINIAETINAKEQANNQLRIRVNDLHARGLYVNANCSNGAATMPRKAGDPKEPNRATKRVRLSEQDEQNLIAIAQDAQKVVIQYNALLKACSPLVTVN